MFAITFTYILIYSLSLSLSLSLSQLMVIDPVTIVTDSGEWSGGFDHIMKTAKADMKLLLTFVDS